MDSSHRLDQDKLDQMRESVSMASKPELSIFWDKPSRAVLTEYESFIDIVTSHPELTTPQLKVILDELISRTIVLTWNQEKLQSLSRYCRELLESGCTNPKDSDLLSGLIYGLDLIPKLPMEEHPFLRGLGLRVLSQWIKNWYVELL